MKESKSEYIRTRIHKYIKRATDACKEDEVKLKMLHMLINSLKISIKNEECKSPISESNTIGNSVDESLIKDLALLSISE
jgi:hypothetical protein